MSQYFAAALALTAKGWTGTEVDLDGLEDLDAVVELLRDLDPDGAGPALLLVEEDDEYLGIVRVDSSGDARSFLSDRRVLETSELAQVLLPIEEVEVPEDEDDDETVGRPQAEPVGEADLLADLGTPAADLLALCAEKGMLPADVLTAVCERAGCAEVLDEVRGV